MQRYLKKRLLGLMEIVSEAHEAMQCYTDNKNEDAARSLLVDCQNCAIEIGSSIEQIEGPSTQTVALLEDYCDTLGKAGQKIDDPAGFRKILIKLRKKASAIESSIKQEIPTDKLQIVFMPYKASMWDCMESVWQAAVDDPDCDAYVVPIPYYDMLPEMKRGDYHYEGKSLPAYVPVTDYRQNFGHPDIIVIHNPYDYANYVTQVHPDFFCEKLKEHTDLLVYIPYFVNLEDVQPYLCVNPGAIHADRVFVQSDRVKETYVKELRIFEKEKNIDINADSKIVALGSPKYDKVIRTRRQDFTLPDEWQALIQKQDGSRKTVVLYVSGMANMLEKKDKALSKLKSVFAYFQQRHDVVLWWRPHPLNLAAYASMQTELLEEYQNIIKAFKQGGWGIYDDTSDMNRAIAVSDAYYGDTSSLAVLYQCTGKPVMIQNSDLDTNAQDAYRLACSQVCTDEKNVWFSSFAFNGLIKMDRQNLTAEYIGSFPKEKRSGWQLFSGIAELAQKLYFAPFAAENIAEYDMQTGTFKTIPIAVPSGGFAGDRAQKKFFSVVAYQHWVFFVPGSYPAIIRYDTVSGQLDSFSDWIEPLGKLLSDKTDIYFRTVHINGSCIIAAACGANAVVVFDMDTCVSDVREVGSPGYRYGGICFDGSCYWMAPRHMGPVVKWDIKTGEYQEYSDYPIGFKPGRFSFININFADDFVWLFPNCANMALKINIKNPQIVPAPEFQGEVESGQWNRYYYTMSQTDGNKLLACTGENRLFIELDTQTDIKRAQNVLLPEAYRKQTAALRSPIFNKEPSECVSAADCIYYEGSSIILDDFLVYVSAFGMLDEAKAIAGKQLEIFKNTVKNADGTAGRAIYAYCKRLAES